MKIIVVQLTEICGLRASVYIFYAIEFHYQQIINIKGASNGSVAPSTVCLFMQLHVTFIYP